jgi:hypothetical protein
MKYFFTIFFLCFVINSWISPNVLLAADTIETLTAKLSSILSQIASIDARLAELRARLAEESDEESDLETDESSESGTDMSLYADEPPSDPDLLEAWINRRLQEEATGSSGITPAWAQTVKDREKNDFPDSYEAMTGGGVFTNRRVGDGQKIIDWNRDPMSSDVNTRTRDLSDYGPTEGSESDHAHETFEGGEWSDEKPISNTEKSGAGGSPLHAHDASGFDMPISSASNVSDNRAVSTSQSEAPSADRGTGTVPSDAESAVTSSSTRASAPSNDRMNLSDEARESLERHAAALQLGMYDSSTGSVAGSTASTQQSAGTPSGNTLSQSPSQGDQDPTTVSQTTGAERSRAPLSSRSERATSTAVGRSGDPNILPGDQRVAAPSSRVQYADPGSIAGDAGGTEEHTLRKIDVVQKKKMMQVLPSLVKVKGVLQNAFLDGHISVEEYRKSLAVLEDTEVYVKDVLIEMNDAQYKSIDGVSSMLKVKMDLIRELTAAARGKKIARALNASEKLIQAALIVDEAQSSMRAAQETKRFIDTAEDMGIRPAETTRFIDSREVMGAHERTVTAGELRVTGKPFIPAYAHSEGTLSIVSDIRGTIEEQRESDRTIHTGALIEHRESTRP